MRTLRLARCSVEGEVDLLDALPLGARAERRLGSRRTAAEENAVGGVHAVDHSIAKLAVTLRRPRLNEPPGRTILAGTVVADFR
jgi:hypothetical protein